MRSSRARFLITFFVLLFLFEVPLLIDSVDRTVIRPFTAGIAAVSGATMRMLGVPVTVRGTIITGPCFSVEIKNGCNGVEASLFLMAAILAFPASGRSRALAAGFGFLLIQAVNLVRVVSLYLVGCYRREWFDAAHLTLWQTIVFAVTVLYFVQWTRKVSPPDAPHRA
jgi:exosortase H (IPTLxxWG-CTERM-specific)